MPPSHPQSSRDPMVNAAVPSPSPQSDAVSSPLPQCDAVPSPSPQSDAVLHPHLPHQSKEAADKSFHPLSHSHSKEVFPQSAAPLPCPLPPQDHLTRQTSPSAISVFQVQPC